jgi:hypothetical protein
MKVASPLVEGVRLSIIVLENFVSMGSLGYQNFSLSSVVMVSIN